jgi:hypothetical protein
MATPSQSSQSSDTPDPAQRPDAEDDPVIEALKKAALEGKKTVSVTGYRGSSGQKDVVRVYPEPDLGTYIDIPIDAILNLGKAERPTASNAGPSTFLISADAKIDVVHAESVEAAFLKGPIFSKIPLKMCRQQFASDDPVVNTLTMISKAYYAMSGVPCTMSPCASRDYHCR